MKRKIHNRDFQANERRRCAAFTLIELMVAVALMSFIVLGLLAMFTQTQRAFRASITQTDVLESGRIATDMIVRELSQISASDRAYTTNFFAEVLTTFNQPLTQGLPGTTRGGPGTEDQRTNLVQRIFFLTQSNQTWLGIGYTVVPDYANAGVGTLYRFSTNHNNYTATNISGEFLAATLNNLNQISLTNLNRISDGVVHFRVRAFATNGYPILYDGIRTNAIFRTNSFYTGNMRLRNAAANIPLAFVPDQVDYYFMSNALPAYLELELGILEPHILDRFKAIGSSNPLAQRRYLSNHVAQVHLFRQRIPVRTVDFSAYQ